MAYTRNPTWVDGVGSTLISAAKLENIESGIEAAAATADSLASQAINAQTGTTYTLVAGDALKMVTCSNASAVTVTVPASTFSAGQRVDLMGIGVGLVTMAPGAGLTLDGVALTSRARWSALSVFFLTATHAVVVGDVA